MGETEGGGNPGEIAVGLAGEEVAYARARFAVDPSTPARLADARTAPTGNTEEVESMEFVDAVADCLSVGLPLDAAVASWRSGHASRSRARTTTKRMTTRASSKRTLARKIYALRGVTR